MKKNLLAIGGFLLLIVGLFSFVNPAKEEAPKYKKVKAITIKLKAFKALKAAKVLPGCVDITKDRKLTPTPGYKLMVDATKKRFAVIPETQDQPSIFSKAKGIEGKEIEGLGTLWCHCGGGNGDDCQFKDGPGKWGFSKLTCEGECSCGMELTDGGPPTGDIIDDIYP